MSKYDGVEPAGFMVTTERVEVKRNLSNDATRTPYISVEVTSMVQTGGEVDVQRCYFALDIKRAQQLLLSLQSCLAGEVGA